MGNLKIGRKWEQIIAANNNNNNNALCGLCVLIFMLCIYVVLLVRDGTEKFDYKEISTTVVGGGGDEISPIICRLYVLCLPGLFVKFVQ